MPWADLTPDEMERCRFHIFLYCPILLGHPKRCFILEWFEKKGLFSEPFLKGLRKKLNAHIKNGRQSTNKEALKAFYAAYLCLLCCVGYYNPHIDNPSKEPEANRLCKFIYDDIKPTELSLPQNKLLLVAERFCNFNHRLSTPGFRVFADDVKNNPKVENLNLQVAYLALRVKKGDTFPDIIKTISTTEWEKKLDSLKKNALPLQSVSDIIAHGIDKIFNDISILSDCLIQLEKDFVAFLAMQPPLAVPDVPLFKKFMVNTKYFFTALPEVEYTRYEEQYYSHLKTHDALFSFLEYSLRETYKVIEPNAEIGYFMQSIDKEVGNEWVKNGNPFVDVGDGFTILHGKYSHLLQLYLLAIAKSLNKINLYEYSWSDIFKMLVRPLNRTLINIWQLCLDRVSPLPNTDVSGPIFFNSLFLSSFAHKDCPQFSNIYRLHYIKKMIHFKQHENFTTYRQATEYLLVLGETFISENDFKNYEANQQTKLKPHPDPKYPDIYIPQIPVPYYRHRSPSFG